MRHSAKFETKVIPYKGTNYTIVLDDSIFKCTSETLARISDEYTGFPGGNLLPVESLVLVIAKQDNESFVYTYRRFLITCHEVFEVPYLQVDIIGKAMIIQRDLEIMETAANEY